MKNVPFGQVFFEGRGRLATKMNITFYFGNEVPNTFHLIIFFEESNIFRENGEKNFWGTLSIFR